MPGVYLSQFGPYLPQKSPRRCIPMPHTGSVATENTARSDPVPTGARTTWRRGAVHQLPVGSESMHSVRQYYEPVKGRLNANFNWPGVITSKSVVMITASEYKPEPGNQHFQHSDYTRFRGDANVWVSSIAPHGPNNEDPGGVEFAVNVDWSNPIPVVVDITVFDPPEAVQP
jgi:hypothetical protein